MTPETVAASFVALAAIGAFSIGARSMFRGYKQQEEPDHRLTAEVPEELLDRPRCVCGEYATEPMPTITRTRGAWDFLRSYFAAPPRYTRYVNSEASFSLCRIHAHVADAKIDEFIFQRIRGLLAETNAKIALEAACFEKEILQKALADSLTNTERKTKQATNGRSNGASTFTALS